MRRSRYAMDGSRRLLMPFRLLKNAGATDRSSLPTTRSRGSASARTWSHPCVIGRRRPGSSRSRRDGPCPPRWEHECSVPLASTHTWKIPPPHGSFIGGCAATRARPLGSGRSIITRLHISNVTCWSRGSINLRRIVVGSAPRPPRSKTTLRASCALMYLRCPRERRPTKMHWSLR